MKLSMAPAISRKLAIAALLACASTFTVAPALAQNVPLPAPRPHQAHAQPRMVTGTVAAQSPEAAAMARAQAAQQRAKQEQRQQQPTPAANPFAALLGSPGSTTALTSKERAIIDRVDKYLSGTQLLSGKFVQVGPDGRRSQGDFFIEKPGRVRFDYDPPSPISIVADGQTLVVRDRRLATQDVYPLSQTPLRFLLADKVDLMKDTNLVAVYADDVFVTVVVEEKNGLVGTSRLMIMFSAKDMQLKQWTVTDPQGFDTTVAVYNLDTTKKPTPGMFHIDFTNYHN
ncbi:MAG: outer membrane lipoprotein carrier protein LolA [Pseudolabrys sp.]|jgi:outer membrane lipoprotein-sorting protein